MYMFEFLVVGIKKRSTPTNPEDRGGLSQNFCPGRRPCSKNLSPAAPLKHSWSWRLCSAEESDTTTALLRTLKSSSLSQPSRRGSRANVPSLCKKQSLYDHSFALLDSRLWNTIPAHLHQMTELFKGTVLATQKGTCRSRIYVLTSHRVCRWGPNIFSYFDAGHVHIGVWCFCSPKFC